MNLNMSTEKTIQQIEDFWNKNLCGKHFIKARYTSKEFFNQYREFRYKKEHHLNYFIDWQSAQNMGHGLSSMTLS